MRKVGVDATSKNKGTAPYVKRQRVAAEGKVKKGKGKKGNGK